MSLIKCHECSRLVSTEATSCPGCGAPPKFQAPARRQESVREVRDDNDDVWSASPSGRQNFGRNLVCLVLSLTIVLIPVAFLLWLEAHLRNKRTRYTVSNRRLSIQSGIFSKRVDDIALFRIRDVDLRQSIWQRMGGIGNLLVISTDSVDPNVMLRGLRDPDRVRRILREQADMSRRREGVRTLSN